MLEIQIMQFVLLEKLEESKRPLQKDLVCLTSILTFT